MSKKDRRHINGRTAVVVVAVLNTRMPEQTTYQVHRENHHQDAVDELLQPWRVKNDVCEMVISWKSTSCVDGGGERRPKTEDQRPNMLLVERDFSNF